MKRVYWLLLAIVIVGALVLSGCTSSPSSTAVQTTAPLATQGLAATQTTSPAAPASVIQLKFANYFPVTSLQSTGWDNFCKEVAKRTNGRINITYYAAESLVAGPSIADAVEAGIADIAYISGSTFPGRYPVSEAISMPLGFQSPYIASHVNDDFLKMVKPAEFGKLHILAGGYSGAQDVWSKKQITTLDDMKGLKIRGLGVGANIAKLLGAVPNGMVSGELYDALSKGVVDATLFPPEGYMTWKIGEICKFATNTWPIFPATSMIIAMNKQSYDRLPADLQKMLDDLSAEWQDKWARDWNQGEVDGVAYANKVGTVFTDLSPTELTKWQNAIAPITDTYIKDMVGKGFAESDVRGWLKYLTDRRDYWLKQQLSIGLKSGLYGPLK